MRASGAWWGCREATRAHGRGEAANARSFVQAVRASCSGIHRDVVVQRLWWSQGGLGIDSPPVFGGPGPMARREDGRWAQKNLLRVQEVSCRGLLGCEPYRPRGRAGGATLPAKAGWRACHRARSLDAALDRKQIFTY